MSVEVALRRGRLASRLTIIAGIWSLGLLLAAVLLPTYSGQTESSANGLTLTSSTFVEVNGPWVLIPVAIPLVACLVVWFALREKTSRGSTTGGLVAWAAAAVVTCLALLAILSIGAFVLPVAVLLACSAELAPLALG